jgi:hypothetical protein
VETYEEGSTSDCDGDLVGGFRDSREGSYQEDTVGVA